MKRQKMRTEQKSNVKNSVGRLVFVGLSLLLQVLWILLLFLRLNAYSTAISLCFSVGAFLVALSIYAKHENAAFKMPWIILILAFPVLGLCIYLVFGHKNVVAKAMRRRFETIEPVLFEQIPRMRQCLSGWRSRILRWRTSAAISSGSGIIRCTGIRM